MRRPNHKRERRQVSHAPDLGRKRVSVASKPESRQRVRVAGQLRELVSEERLFSLSVGEGESIRALAPNVPAQTLTGLLDRTVLISGTGFFSRSGSLLEIEADHVELAQGDVSFWSRVPRQALGETDLRALRGPRDDRPGLSAVAGQWPGDESEEEILAILEEMS